MPSKDVTIRYSQVNRPADESLGDNEKDRYKFSFPVAVEATLGKKDYQVTSRHMDGFMSGIYEDINVVDLTKYLYFDPDTMVGSGKKTDPVRVKADSLDKELLHIDRLSYSMVGDNSFADLPISGSYFSISYPYGTGQKYGTAMLEKNGSILCLMPVSNGLDCRYVYHTLTGDTRKRMKHTPSDSVYSPVGTMNGAEPIQYIGTASQTAMLAAKGPTGGLMKWCFIKLNGTLNHQYHTMIDMPSIAGIGSEGFYSNLLSHAFSTVPVAVVVGGRNYVFMVDFVKDEEGQMISCYEVHEDGSTTKVTNWATNSHIGSWSGKPSIVLNENGVIGKMTGKVRGGYELYDPLDEFDYGDRSQHNDRLGGRKRIFLGIAQQRDKVTLMINRYFSCRSKAVANIRLVHINYAFDITGLGTSRPVATERKERQNDIVTLTKQASGVVADPQINYGYESHTNKVSAYTPLADGSTFHYTNAFALATKTTVRRSFPGNEGKPDAMTAVDIQTSLITGTSSKSSEVISPNKPAPTAIVSAAVPYPLNNKAFNVTGFLTYSYATTEEKVPPGISIINGDPVTTYKFPDGTSYKGFAPAKVRTRQRNYDLATPVVYYRSKAGSISQGIALTSTARYNARGDGYKYGLEIDSRGNVLQWLTLPKSTVEDLEKQLDTILQASTTYKYVWRLSFLPNDLKNRVGITLGILDTSGTVGSFHRRHGIATATYSKTGDTSVVTKITLDEANLGPSTGRINADTIYDNETNTSQAGFAYYEESDTSAHFIAKEGTRSAYQGGIWTMRGCEYNKHGVNNKGITKVGEQTGLGDGGGTATCFPCIMGNGLGIGVIDNAAKSSTYYVYIPVFGHTNPEYAKGVVIASPAPAAEYNVHVTAEIEVYLDGKLGIIPEGSHDLAKLVKSGGNTKIFAYVKMSGDGVASLFFDTVEHIERSDQTMIATIICNNETVERIIAKPYSRLGTYRTSVEPRGASVPATVGSPARNADTFWLRRYY